MENGNGKRLIPYILLVIVVVCLVVVALVLMALGVPIGPPWLRRLVNRKSFTFTNNRLHGR